MLMVTRKVGDAIAIGDRIVVKVVGIQGNRVQLGIEAPREIEVRDAEPAERRPEGPKK